MGVKNVTNERTDEQGVSRSRISPKIKTSILSPKPPSLPIKNREISFLKLKKRKVFQTNANIQKKKTIRKNINNFLKNKKNINPSTNTTAFQ